MSTSPICKWDVTFGISNEDISTKFDDEFLIELCKETCKKWCFQLEKGETGFIHYQMRLNLIKKGRKKQVLDLFRIKIGDEYMQFFHITPTNKNVQDFYSYVNKAQSRIGEPHSDRDVVADCNKKVMTTQLKEYRTHNPRPYQLQLQQIIEQHKITPDFRSIYFIQDTYGSIGKSVFVEDLEYKGLCEELPPMNNMEDISQWVASTIVDKNGNYIAKAKDCYFIDIPRSRNEDKLNGFLSGIEHLKDGKAFDKRYLARKVRFNRPIIVCLCNSFPSSFDGLTRNRWKCYTVNKQYELVRYEQCPSLLMEQELLQQNELTMIEDEQEGGAEEAPIENEICVYTPDKYDKMV